MKHSHRTLQLLIACLMFAAGISCTQPPVDLNPGESLPTAPSRLTGADGQTYLLHLPNGREPAEGWPLVIALHGIRSDAVQMQELTGFNEVADDEGFAVAYADAGDGFWLDLGATLADESGVASDSDVAFIGALIDTLIEDHDVDPDAVYLAGFSNGGLFAVQLACRMPERIAAIGVVAAAGTKHVLDDCDIDSPVGYVAFHGTADSIVPFDGGDLVAGIPGIVEFADAEETLAHWAQSLGCSDQPRVQRLRLDPDYPTTSTRYTSCDSGTSAQLYAIEGGGHGWPGGNNDASATATTSANINATRIMWQFFAQHRR